MSEKETLVINYTGQKEHIDLVKEASKDFKNLEDFFQACVRKYLENYWMPRKIEVPTALFNELSTKARNLDITVDDYADQILRKSISHEVKAE